MAWMMPAAVVAGSALGGILGSQKGPSQTQTTDQNPWQPTIPYLNEMMARIQQYSNQPAPYGSPGEMVAPLTPEQMQARDTLFAATGPDGASRTIGQGQQAIQPFLSGQYMNVENNPYLQAATNAAIRPITQNYQENVLPGIRSNFNAGTDAFDQSREGIAQGIAGRGYLDAVSGVSANMANRGYETGLQATQGAISQIPGLTTASIAPGQAQWNIGALLQQHNQQMASAPGTFDQMQQQRLQFPTSLYSQIGQIGRGGTTTTSGAQGNPYLSALGGGILGAQVYNMWPRSPTSGGGGGSAPVDNSGMWMG